MSERHPNYFYYYACLPSSLHTVSWTFRDLTNIYPCPVNSGKEARQLADFYNCTHLYIGGPQIEEKSFDQFYYEQHQVPFNLRWDLAETPQGPKSEFLYTKLNPKNEPYLLVNATQSGNMRYELKIHNPQKLKVIEVHAATNNIYDWTKLTLEATEIHTIDTSFIHFVENLYANRIRGGLFYHLARTTNTEFTRKLSWTNIYYT